MPPHYIILATTYSWTIIKSPSQNSCPLDRFFRGPILSMLNPIHVFTLTNNFSKFHVNQSTNERAVQVITYQNIYYVPLPNKWSPWQILLKINPIHALTITDNFPKFLVYRSTNVGVIHATTYYDTNLTKPPSPKSDPLTYFSENQSHSCFYFPKFCVYQSTNVGAIQATTYHDTRMDRRTDRRTDRSKTTSLRGV
jgi:hypothetical protein